MSAFVEFVERYGPKAGEDGAVLFVREVFAVAPDPWQEKVLRAYGRGERRISIRACHGPGKTALAAWLVWLMMLTRYPQKTVATAPSRGQLEDALIAEVKKWYARLPEPLQTLFNVKQNRIELTAAPNECFFTARTARAENPEALQGVHSEHVLLIADEASGVPEQIFEAAAGSMSGHNATTLLLGNPVRTQGFFFDTHHNLRDMWFTVHVTGVPGGAGEYSPRVSPDFVEDIARRYGRESNAFRIRALGEFPTSDLDTVIPFEFVESARNRDIVIPDNAKEIWGLDVARFGDDENALVRRSRLGVNSDIRVWSGVDLMHTAGIIKQLWDETEPTKRPEEILVDVIGLGGGVVDRLVELKLPVRGINVGESSAFKDKYPNLRSELWFAAREWLSHRDRTLPLRCTCPECKGGTRIDHAEALHAQLVAPKYRPTSSGKVQVEPKDRTKARLRKSPNVADALVLTFASEPATLIHGSGTRGWAVNWNESIRRDVAVV